MFPAFELQEGAYQHFMFVVYLSPWGEVLFHFFEKKLTNSLQKIK
jgi:hypothetical protein